MSSYRSIELGFEDLLDETSDAFEDPDVELAEQTLALDDEDDADAEDEVDDDLEDARVDELLAELDAEEAVEEFGAELPGRHRMVSRMRSRLHDASTESGQAWSEGHRAGYLQAMRDQGVVGRKAEEAYGAVMPAVTRAVKSTVRAVSPHVKGLVQDGVAMVANELQQFLSEPVTDALPPVYMADEECLDVEGDDLLESECVAGLRVQDRYGSTTKYGFVGGHPRKSEREAAHRALARSGQKIQATPRKRGESKPFIEDADAEPMLYAGGVVLDPVLGELAVVPCPSCSRVSEEMARFGSDHTCIVCEDYGAVLVPVADLDDWYGSASYGIAPLLIAAGKLGWNLGKKHLYPAAKRAVQKWKQDAAEADAAVEEGSAEDFSDDVDASLDGAVDVAEGPSAPVSTAVRVLLPE